MQSAYIVAGYRTAVGKSKRGFFRFFRPDDLAIEVISGLLASVPQLDTKLIDDVVVGNAVPEAEQGLQVGRIIANKAIGEWAAGVTVNRYCGSGLEAIAIATAKIQEVILPLRVALLQQARDVAVDLTMEHVVLLGDGVVECPGFAKEGGVVFLRE